MATSSKSLVITRPFEHLLCGTMELRLKIARPTSLPQ